MNRKDRTMKDSDPKVSAIMYTVDSLNRLRDHYVGIDRDCIGLCIRLLDEYKEKLECREGVAPKLPAELEAVIMLLCKVSSDMEVTIDILNQDVRELDRSLSEKVLAA